MYKSRKNIFFQNQNRFFSENLYLIDGIKIKENNVFVTQGHTKTSLNVV